MPDQKDNKDDQFINGDIESILLKHFKEESLSPTESAMLANWTAHGEGRGAMLAEIKNTADLPSMLNKLGQFNPEPIWQKIVSKIQADGYWSAEKIQEAVDLSDAGLEKSASDFLHSLGCRFWLVGSFWKGDDQIDRFLAEGIWEKGHDDDSYTEIINQVSKNDLLIIKSTFASEGVSYLRVKAIGIVTFNPQDGTQLEVDWKVVGLRVDVEELGHYRYTISEPNFQDVVYIVSYLDPKVWGRLRPVAAGRVETIPELVGDSDKGMDHLDIARDVNAFAKIIAAKTFAPPLAIALFAEWGFGKSFFMRKLKERIIELSDRASTDKYCTGIAHIHLNAWSYVDSNLWASLVSKIFEGLNEYISANSKTDQFKKEIERHLTTHLSIAKEQITALEIRRDSVSKQLAQLEEKKKTITKELDAKLNRVETHTLWNVLTTIDNEFKAKEKIIASLQSNASWKLTETELQKIIPSTYWDDPQAAYDRIRSKYTFIAQFFRRDKIAGNLIALAAILLLIFFVPLLLELLSYRISTTHFLIPQAGLSLLILAGSVWVRAEKVYRRLQPVVSSFWTVKEEYDRQIKKATIDFQQEEKALKMAIDKEKAEILLLEKQIENAQAIKTDLQFKINNALATEALYSFIDGRSRSDDYKKHLGIISIIRKDFEILNDLFIGHNQEAMKAATAKVIKDKLTRPLERIILYIDDLDRCPEDIVVQVLEAVNLLMAFPLFIVIVGVDPRWINNSLIKKHSTQFAGGKQFADNPDLHLQLFEPSVYLEKIFQIPFHLKEANNANVREMIRNLAQPGSPPPDEASAVNRPDSQSLKPEQNSSAENRTAESNFAIPPLPDNPEILLLTKEEIALMQDMSTVIGSNPRAIKRFLNIFRIIKAHEELNYKIDSENRELLTILFLIALPLGRYKKLLPSFESFIHNPDNATKPLALYLQKKHSIGNQDALKHELDVTLSDQSSFTTLQHVPAGLLHQHNALARRFRF